MRFEIERIGPGDWACTWGHGGHGGEILFVSARGCRVQTCEQHVGHTVARYLDGAIKTNAEIRREVRELMEARS